MTKHIRKRDGRIKPFEEGRIYNAIEAAWLAVYPKQTDTDATEAVRPLTDAVVALCADEETVESVQDKVVQVLRDHGYSKVADQYANYRAERTRYRESRTEFLEVVDSFFTEDAQDGSSHKENANINASSVSGAFYRIGSEASKDYYQRCLIPKEFVDAHEDGYSYYHDRDYYGLSINCMQHDLLKMFKKGFSTGNAYITDPQSISSAMALTCVILQSGQTDLFGGESIPAWDFYMEPYVERSFQKYFKKHLQRLNFASIAQQEAYCKENHYQEHTPVFESDDLYKAYSWAKKDTEAETYQAAQAMVFNLNSLASRAGGQVVFSSINLGTCIKAGGRLATKALLAAIDKGIGKGITSLFPIVIFKLKDGVTYKPGDPNYDIRLLAEKVTAKRMFPNYSNIDAPYNLKYYKEGHPETEVAYMGMAAGHETVNVLIEKYAELLFKGEIAFSLLYDMIPELDASLTEITFDEDTEYYNLERVPGLSVRTYDSRLQNYVAVKKIMTCHRPAKGEVWAKVGFYSKGYSGSLTLTSDHPLYCPNRGRVMVKDLKVDDVLFSTKTQSGVQITGIYTIENACYRGYDLETESDRFDLSGIVSHNCRTRVIANVNGPEIVTDRGNLSFTTLNLPRFAIEASKEALDKDLVEGLFFQKLDKYLDLASRQLHHRYEIQCNRKVYNFPYVMEQGAYMGSEYLQPTDKIKKAVDNGTLSFGFVGLAECLKVLTGHDHSEGQQYQDLGLKIVKRIRDYADKLTDETHLNWTVIATPAEFVAGTLLRKDRKKFGVIPGVTDKEWYTNSFHVPVERKIQASEKIRIEAPYHSMTNAG